MYTTILSTSDLAYHLNDPDWVFVDCRFVLGDPEKGRRDYYQAHIPGAVYAHLDEDLSGPVVPGVSGRHPLPEVETIRQKLGQWGIGPGVQVVTYDDTGGAIAAARLWWLLRWLGHPAAAVLDGGWQAWVDEGRSVRSGQESCPARDFTPHLLPGMVVSTQEVADIHKKDGFRILDARAHERYLGRNETIDPIAGHIPGALSFPYADNLTPTGRFQSPNRLRERYARLLGDVPAERTIVYCGSGVSAAQNVLAMAHAGLGLPRLYAGSWSEWINAPGRPVANPDRL